MGARRARGPASIGRMSERWRVTLPAQVREPFQVFVNGVPQREGIDYARQGPTLLFDRPLEKERRLGAGRWLLGAFGIGTYGNNDSVDVRYEVAGRPQVAQGLPIQAPGEDDPATAGPGSEAS